MTTPMLSIVVPTFGRSEVLYRVIGAIADQTLKDVEVIIVDQNPAGFFDDSALHAAGAPLTRLRQTAPNAAAARNLGFAVATGRYVLFLDDDELPDPDFCAHAVATLERHPDVRCLSPMVYLAGKKDGAVTRYRTRAAGRSLAGTSLFELTTAGSGGILFEREYFRESGGFDELLFQYAGNSEDKDLIYRMRRQGMRVWCDATLWLLHDTSWPGGCQLRTRSHRRVRIQVVRATLMRGRIRNGPPFRLGIADIARAARYVVASSRGQPGGWQQLLRRPAWHVGLLRREIRQSLAWVERHAERYADPARREHLRVADAALRALSARST